MTRFCSWGPCRMEVFQKPPLAVPFAFSPNAGAQLISCGIRCVLFAWANVRVTAQGGGLSPEGTRGHGKLLGEGENNHGRMTESYVTTQMISPGISLSMILVS